MSYKEKIIKLAKSYEGEDKLGILTEISMDFNNTIDIRHDRYSRDGEDKEPVTTDREAWFVTLRYQPNKKSYSSNRIKSEGATSLEECYLILQEYLKIELAKVEVRNRVRNGTLSEDELAEKPRDIFKELAVAIRDEIKELKE